ncbi:MAG: MotA/TolQ/ExbB proton channel family protein [Desulfobacula sp.]|jgi:biopolymer transport protein ExbB
MFEGKTIWEVINMGGFTMYMLMAASILSLGVFFERFLSYRKKAVDRVSFMDQIRLSVEKGDIAGAVKFCETITAPVAAVALSALRHAGKDENLIANAAEREIMLETADLEKYTSIVGTIGNIAVYIGLFGTVLGIVRSFHNMSQIGSGGISVVIGGVAEALICTAAGLSVAIPAVVVYNYFLRRVDGFVMDMEYCSSATKDLIAGKKLL